MSDTHEQEPSRFSAAAFVVVVAVVSLCFFAGPYIQAARDAARRDECHDYPHQRVHIFGFHPATCPPCRRQMIENIKIETVSPEKRVAWIQSLVSQDKDKDSIITALQQTAKSNSSEVRDAAEESLRKLQAAGTP